MKMEQLMCMLVLFVAAASGSSPNTQTSLTVAPSGCSGFEFDGLNSKFSYTLQLDSIDQADCVRLALLAYRSCAEASSGLPPCA